jgi:hypothetical protein
MGLPTLVYEFLSIGAGGPSITKVQVSKSSTFAILQGRLGFKKVAGDCSKNLIWFIDPFSHYASGSVFPAWICDADK